MLIIEADQLQGLAIASQLAARPDAVIFAGARDPASAVELKTLADAHPGRVHVLQVISADRANNNAAVEEIRKLAGRLDVIIANAGISDCFQNALEVPQAEMNRFVGEYQRPARALSSSIRPPASQPITEICSDLVGQWQHRDRVADAGEHIRLRRVEGGRQLGGAQAASRLHRPAVVFPINPGLADTDMAQSAFVKDIGMKKIKAAFTLISTDESARGILVQVDIATRETHGGQFVDYTGLGKWVW